MELNYLLVWVILAVMVVGFIVVCLKSKKKETDEQGEVSKQGSASDEESETEEKIEESTEESTEQETSGTEDSEMPKSF